MSTNRRLFWSALVGAATVWGQSASAQPPTQPAAIKSSDFKPGELLVKFQAGATSQAARSAHAAIGARAVRTYGFIGWQKVALPKSMSVEQAMAQYRKMPGVQSVALNAKLRALRVPNDPRFGTLYGMNKISAPIAWNTATGSAGTVVAVIDTGVAYNHEDLAANMWRNPGESGSGKETNRVDDDNNGYVDDIYGADVINGDGDPFDDNEHGTHVSGTIGGVGNNSKGVAGVNWNVKIMALKFLDYAGDGYTEGAISCFEYVAAMKRRGINVRVTNNSWGGGGFNQALLDAINATGAAGILNICAAGNDGYNNDDDVSYPSGFDSESIIAVAASDQNDNRPSFSQYGATSVDLAAPGVEIVSSVPGNGTYDSFDGTSMATPHVAGAVALLAGHLSSLSAAEIKTLILGGVDRLPQWQGVVLSGGRLNIARSLLLSNPNGPPIVAQALPQGTDVPRRPTIEVSFSRAMNRASVESAFSVSPTVAGAFAWSNGDKTLTFTPGANFRADSQITVKIAGTATDTAGRTLDGNFSGTIQGSPTDDFAWNFRTTPPPPPNDPFGSPLVLSGTSGTVNGTNRHATRQSGEPEHAGVGSSRSVWYRWTATSNTPITLNTQGSDFDTLLAVYTGAAVNALTEIAADDDTYDFTSMVAFTPVAGTTYAIAVDGYGGSQGTITLNWELAVPPANDNFAGATLISGGYGSATGNSTLASAQNGEPQHAGEAPNHSLWYRWVAPSNGRFIFTTAGSAFDTVLGIYRGASLSGLTEVASDNDSADGYGSAAGFTATAGTTYHIAVDGSGSQGGQVQLTWYANDHFAAARGLDGPGGSYSGYNFAATAQTGEPLHAGHSEASLWFRWRAPVTGTASFATSGSYFDTVLAAYAGSSLSTLTQLAQNDDSGDLTSYIEFPVVSGRYYYIALDGYNGAQGVFDLIWSMGAGELPALSVGNQRALAEGSATAPGSTVFPITLSAPSAETVMVRYATANGTATAGEDYVASTGTLAFAPGEVTKRVRITFIGDAVAESNETFFLTLNSPLGATIADSRGSAYIRNDDGPQVFVDNATPLREGNSGTTPQQFEVRLSAASTNTITVEWTTGNGTAGPADFTAANGTLTFAPGETQKRITVLVKGDTTVEPTETYRVKLTRSTMSLIADSQGIGYIVNDDAAPATATDESPSQ